ncbi:MAG: cation:proton antiporter [Fimbriimonadaceae bacterium]|nr:cation:proton antiporter [Fimbriimonadaceae bacterium]
MNDLQLGIHVFLQIAIILAVCRLIGWLGRRFLGQTQVVGEMIAGVCLGPSLLGAVAPQLSDALFPLTLPGGGRHPTIQVVYAISQVGLSLYMFLVGVDLDINLLRSRAKGALAVSASGIVVPFILGIGLVHLVYPRFGLFEPHVGVDQAALYMGAAMCITAFPMLARIIREKGISGTSMGTLALSAGAMDDVVAWVGLAVVVASTKSNPSYAWLAIGGGILYAIFMLTVGKALFRKVAQAVEKANEMSADAFAVVLIVVMLGSWFTDLVGVYAVFGAFICGTAIPKGALAEGLKEKIEPFVVSFMLPLFFVFSGLNTKMGLIDSPELWTFALAALGVAVFGKGVSCTLAARANKEPWRESFAIGTLMNSRGLMELIILNIGLQQGVITQRLYTVLVLMAVITTLMASPLYSWIMEKKRPGVPAGEPA